MPATATGAGSSSSAAPSGDRLPDAPRVDWLTLSTPAGEAAPGAPYPLILSYTFPADQRGEVEAQLFIRANDPAAPRTVIPIRVRLADPAPPARLTLGPPIPNPFAAETRLNLALPAGTEWRVEIFDVSGRLVRRLGQGTAGNVVAPLVWDGRDDHGRRRASGCYYARASGGGVSRTRTIVFVR